MSNSLFFKKDQPFKGNPSARTDTLYEYRNGFLDLKAIQRELPDLFAMEIELSPDADSLFTICQLFYYAVGKMNLCPNQSFKSFDMKVQFERHQESSFKGSAPQTREGVLL